MTKRFMSMDGNVTATHCAYTFTELSAAYPITPSSPMAEVVDQQATQGRKNIFDNVVKAVELQSEGGAAGTIHSILQAGSLATTLIASQGLLLMIPNIYKMVDERPSGIIRVAVRALTTRAPNIFGDHEDIYACRQSGVCMLVSRSVQEAMGPAGAACLTAIKGSVPFMHLFDEFRTSHETQKIEVMDTDVFKGLVDKEALAKLRKNALNPYTNPVIRDDAENNDIFFRGMEARNKHLDAIPDIVADYMRRTSEIIGREHAPFTYYGASDAEHVIVAMGFVTEAAKEAIDALITAGEKIDTIKVHLYRLFSVKYLLTVLLETVKKIAVLDCTKETGSMRGPLHFDILSALKDKGIEIISGRYGMGPKDTQSYHIKTVFDELKKDEMKDSFTIGITDDATSLSLEADSNLHVSASCTSCLFWRLGSDDTVSTNRSTIKIIGDDADQYAQAYPAYDSKKIGGVTRSHLRFGSSPIRSTYCISNTDFISCSLDAYMFKYDTARDIKEGGGFLLNTTLSREEIVEHTPNRMKVWLVKKYAKFYIINATKIAQEIGMGRRTNTTLQSAFFVLNEQIIPYDTTVELMKATAKGSYPKKSNAAVQLNYKATDVDKAGVEEITVDVAQADLPFDFGRKLTGGECFGNHAAIINGLEDYDMPVSAFTGNFPLGGSIHNNVAFEERRTTTVQVPTWHPENCIQCGICSFICPHATIRPFLLAEKEAAVAPMEFETITPVGKGVENLKYRIQVIPANYVDCGLCTAECPDRTGNKALEMADINEKLGEEPLADYLFRHIEYKTEFFPADVVRGSQFMMSYFEVSGAYPSCGETPYCRLVPQLFGHDMLVANVTGCSMICCSSTPSTPLVNNSNGEGVAWANSLLEDNVELKYGMALVQDHKEPRILKTMGDNMENIESALKGVFTRYLEIRGDRDAEGEIVPTIKELVAKSDIAMVRELVDIGLVSKSIWVVGGDGWAYNIDYDRLDHILANDLNVNVLVLGTEVYSNTDGQSPKSSQATSIVKSAAGGKTAAKKDLGQIAIAYGHVYVAAISMGISKGQTLGALKRTKSYNGPFLILAYSPCAEHGIKGGLANHQRAQTKAVECGYFDLYRYDLRKEIPLTVDSKESDYEKVLDFMMTEARYNQLPKVKNETTYKMLKKTKKDAMKRYKRLLAIAKEEM